MSRLCAHFGAQGLRSDVRITMQPDYRKPDKPDMIVYIIII